MRLLCKKTVEMIINEGYFYEVYKETKSLKDGELPYTLIGNGDMIYSCTDDERSTNYIYNFFYTENEYRDMKINKLLDEVIV